METQLDKSNSIKNSYNVIGHCFQRVVLSPRPVGTANSNVYDHDEPIDIAAMDIPTIDIHVNSTQPTQLDLPDDIIVSRNSLRNDNMASKNTMLRSKSSDPIMASSPTLESATETMSANMMATDMSSGLGESTDESNFSLKFQSKVLVDDDVTPLKDDSFGGRPLPEDSYGRSNRAIYTNEENLDTLNGKNSSPVTDHLDNEDTSITSEIDLDDNSSIDGDNRVEYAEEYTDRERLYYKQAKNASLWVIILVFALIAMSYICIYWWMKMKKANAQHQKLLEEMKDKMLRSIMVTKGQMSKITNLEFTIKMLRDQMAELHNEASRLNSENEKLKENQHKPKRGNVKSIEHTILCNEDTDSDNEEGPGISQGDVLRLNLANLAARMQMQRQ